MNAFTWVKCLQLRGLSHVAQNTAKSRFWPTMSQNWVWGWQTGSNQLKRAHGTPHVGSPMVQNIKLARHFVIEGPPPIWLETLVKGLSGHVWVMGIDPQQKNNTAERWRGFGPTGPLPGRISTQIWVTSTNFGTRTGPKT